MDMAKTRKRTGLTEASVTFPTACETRQNYVVHVSATGTYDFHYISIPRFGHCHILAFHCTLVANISTLKQMTGTMTKYPEIRGQFKYFLPPKWASRIQIIRRINIILPSTLAQMIEHEFLLQMSLLPILMIKSLVCLMLLHMPDHRTVFELLLRPLHEMVLLQAFNPDDRA